MRTRKSPIPGTHDASGANASVAPTRGQRLRVAHTLDLLAARVKPHPNGFFAFEVVRVGQFSVLLLLVELDTRVHGHGGVVCHFREVEIFSRRACF